MMASSLLSLMGCRNKAEEGSTIQVLGADPEKEATNSSDRVVPPKQVIDIRVAIAIRVQSSIPYGGLRLQRVRGVSFGRLSWCE